jgi:predicted transcriptional regulator
VVAPARVNDTTIRIDKGTSATLDSLAKKKGESKKDIIARAVERMRREEILEDANVGYAAMKSDPVVWREELEERALWESTLSDGLNSE